MSEGAVLGWMKSLRPSPFDNAYKKNSWGGSESRSGTGSSLEQTRVVRKYLAELVDRRGIQTLVDVPCGDFFWMKEVPFVGQYIGLDIVNKLIEDNRSRHQAPHRRFEVVDIVSAVPPAGDLVVCRDLLVHLSYRDAKSALKNLSSSGSKWLLTTTFPGTKMNRDIRTGQWRPINLELPPFSFPPPVELVNEECTEAGGAYADKSLGLWKIESLQSSL